MTDISVTSGDSLKTTFDINSSLRRRDRIAFCTTAKLTIELAKQGQFTATSLRNRILKEMKPKGRLN